MPLDFYRLYLTGQESPSHPTGMGFRDCIAWQSDVGDFILFYMATCESVLLAPEQFRGLAPELAHGYSFDRSKDRIKRNAEQLDRLKLPYDREMTEYLLGNFDVLAAPPPPAAVDETKFRTRVRNRG